MESSRARAASLESLKFGTCCNQLKFCCDGREKRKVAGGSHAKDAKGAKVDEAPNDLRLAHSGSEQSLAQGGGAG